MFSRISVPYRTCQKYFEGKIDAVGRYLYGFLTRNMGPFPWLNLRDGQIIIGLASVHGQKFHPRFTRFLDFLKGHFGLEIKRALATEACVTNTLTPLSSQAEAVC